MSDANWAGDRQPRKSTSGRVMMVGQQYQKVRQKTQEYHSAFVHRKRTLYHGQLCVGPLRYQVGVERCGVLVGDVVKTDASATLDMIQKQCLGKVRHIDTAHLHVQNFPWGTP